MSNRKRLKQPPPPEVAALARTYQCGHCTADIRPKLRGGLWHIDVLHDGTCPVLRGAVDRAPQLAEAMTTAFGNAP